MREIGTLLLISARFCHRHRQDFLGRRGDAPRRESVPVECRDGGELRIGGVVVVPRVRSRDNSQGPDCRLPDGRVVDLLVQRPVQVGQEQRVTRKSRRGRTKSDPVSLPFFTRWGGMWPRRAGCSTTNPRMSSGWSWSVSCREKYHIGSISGSLSLVALPYFAASIARLQCTLSRVF